MDVAAEILAEMALNPPQEPTCHFMRLPLELRKRVYALLLLPTCVPRVHCCNLSQIKQCSPGGRFLASTCKPKATSMRTIGCGTCEWRGGDVHTAIISTNKAISEEATDVLYENSQALCFRKRSLYLSDGWLNDSTFKIRRFVFVIPVPETDPADTMRPTSFLNYNIKLIELHLDVDLTKSGQLDVDAENFGMLLEVDGVELVVDFHIVCAWDDDNAWSEPVSQRRHISEARAHALDEQAQHMRLKFIEDLGDFFKTHGRTLVIREN